MNLSEYVEHVTILSSVLTTACCTVVGLRFGLVGMSDWLVVTHIRIHTTFRCIVKPPLPTLNGLVQTAMYFSFIFLISHYDALFR